MRPGGWCEFRPIIFAMNCPGCNEAMEAVVASGVEAHRCPGCEGTWLSLDAFVNAEIEAENRTLIDSLLQDANVKSGRPTQRKCPTCPDTHLAAIFSQRLEIDRCPTCSGLFFDKGELDGDNEATVEHREEGVAKSLATELAAWAIIVLFGH